MLPLTLVILLTLVLSHWLLEPIVVLATPMFQLSWIGWALLIAALWCFAGERGHDPPR
jgi:hypothetical protein